jgi:hypothetical protein
MRLNTIADADGNVVGISTAPDGGVRSSVPNLPPELREVEIDAPDITDEMEINEIFRRLRDLKSNYKVDHSARKFVQR